MGSSSSHQWDDNVNQIVRSSLTIFSLFCCCPHSTLNTGTELTMKNATPPPTDTFIRKKVAILSQLSVPDAEYTDASPKGSVDAGIRTLIDEINVHDGLVTTSSCAGRVSVYLEGRKKAAGEVTEEGGAREAANQGSAVGGKGGGEWLFVSHDPVEGVEGGHERLFGMVSGEGGEGLAASMASSEARLIHFKFEPMVSYILFVFGGCG